jgi:oxygen-independent coproporphyrinogen III oxidase
MDMISSVEMDPYSVYIHFPFCKTRCSYCDFCTVAGSMNKIPEYVLALCKEIELVAQSAPERLQVHTIYFGGGTPSLLSINDVKFITRTLAENFNLSSEPEITLEANPGTVSENYLMKLRETGINRLSLGMQSANPDELRLLGRRHTFQDVKQVVDWARKSSFENINLDLIYGLPSQTMSGWQLSLSAAVDLAPEHLSLYALTLEDGTSLARKIQNGKVIKPDDDLAADLYEYADEFLERNHYSQYEISNWSRENQNGKSYRCIHNLQYWNCLPYLGFGTSACGYIDRQRLENSRNLSEYIDQISNGKPQPFPLSQATKMVISNTEDAEMQEKMMMGLRLVSDGISKSLFRKRFGRSMEKVFEKEISYLISASLLEWSGERNQNLRLTKRGKLLGNQVFIQFVNGK